MRSGFKIAIRLVLCLLPLSLTPILGWLISDGYLNFGGGCKDIVLLIPWILWALLYLVIFLGCWVKKYSLGKTLVWGAAGATGILGLLWLVLMIWASDFLGLRGI